MNIKIKITKDVLKRSMWCGTDKHKHPTLSTGKSCAIALAVRDIFPIAFVSETYISTTGTTLNKDITLPTIATLFIAEFDKLRAEPEERLKMHEFEFEIDCPEPVIEKIGITEALEIIAKSETLELVNK